MSVVSTSTNTASSGGGQDAAVFSDPELLASVAVGDRDEASESAENQGAVGVDGLVAVPGHFDAAGDEEGAEHIQDPGKAGDENGTGGDEDAPPEDQRAEHAVEQHPVLVFPGHGEVGKDDREDEHVVHREGFLDDVAGEVLGGELRAPPAPPPDQPAEADCEGDPYRRPCRGLAHAYDVGFAVGKQVHRQHDHDDGQHHRPHPPRNRHDWSFLFARARWPWQRCRAGFPAESESRSPCDT